MYGMFLKMMFEYNKHKIMPTWQLIMQQQIKAAYLAIAILSICSYCHGVLPPCQSNQWFDPIQDKCVQCTKCENQYIVIRRCQVYQDTTCGTIGDIQIDWKILAKTEPNWKERRKEKPIEEDNTNWDWQSASLIIAAVACLLFFLMAAYISVHHVRQWRRMERRLDRDVEELSTKLMARLAEAQNIESGSFLAENPVKDQNGRPIEVRCVYLEQLLAGKKGKTPTRGNFYIEETGSKGETLTQSY